MNRPIPRFWLVIVTIVFCLTACKPVDKSASYNVTSTRVGDEVKPSYQIEFPRDHNQHIGFGIEWWYFTANLEDENGQPLWLQWTLFRNVTANQTTSEKQQWTNGQNYMAHASLHTMKEHYFEERFARGGVGNAGVTMEPINLFLDHWQFQSIQTDSLFPGELNFTVDGKVDVNLAMITDAKPILHGEAGYSLKYPNGPFASHYYSQPFIEVSGQVAVDGIVKNVSGNAWYDHEWSSQVMGQDFSGWDWFSMHLANNQKLMLFTLQSDKSDTPEHWYGTYVDEQGTQHTIKNQQVAVQVMESIKLADRKFSSKWHIRISDHDLDLQIELVKDNQFNSGLFSYYEGAINIAGSTQGVGFVEMTGE